MCTDYLDLGHYLFADNLCTSERLASWLLDRKTLFSGTVKGNRGVPAFVNDAHLRQGQTIFACVADLLCCRCRDKRDVMIMTSEFTMQVTQIEKQTQ